MVISQELTAIDDINRCPVDCPRPWLWGDKTPDSGVISPRHSVFTSQRVPYIIIIIQYLHLKVPYIAELKPSIQSLSRSNYSSSYSWMNFCEYLDLESGNVTFRRHTGMAGQWDLLFRLGNFGEKFGWVLSGSREQKLTTEIKKNSETWSSEIMIEFLLKFRLRVHFHGQFAAMAIVL